MIFVQCCLIQFVCLNFFNNFFQINIAAAFYFYNTQAFQAYLGVYHPVGFWQAEIMFFYYF